MYSVNFCIILLFQLDSIYLWLFIYIQYLCVLNRLFFYLQNDAKLGKRKLEDKNGDGPAKKRTRFDHTVFVAKVHPSTSVNELKKRMTSIGPVVDCYIPLRPGEKQNKGFAFVSFDSEESMQNAISQDGKISVSTYIYLFISLLLIWLVGHICFLK